VRSSATDVICRRASRSCRPVGRETGGGFFAGFDGGRGRLGGGVRVKDEWLLAPSFSPRRPVRPEGRERQGASRALVRLSGRSAQAGQGTRGFVVRRSPHQGATSPAGACRSAREGMAPCREACVEGIFGLARCHLLEGALDGVG